MNKVKILLISLFATAMISTSAFAGSWGMGVSGNLATVAAEGTETDGDTAGAETENSVKSASAGNNFLFASVFTEYSFGADEMYTFGIDYIPGSADVSNKTLSRTDASQGAYTAEDTGTVKANAEITDHITYYLEMGKMNGIYGKIGFAQVDIDVQQNNSTGYGTYPDKTLDAWTYGLGYKGEMGANGYFKIEGFMYDYDSYSGTSTSTNAHTVSADLDVSGAKFALGYKF